MLDRRAFYEQRGATRRSPQSRYYHALLEHYYRFFIPDGGSVLEFGCGNGDLLAAVSPATGLGVDFSESAIESARARHPGLSFAHADVLAQLPGQKFDYIIMSDLVNDLTDVQAALEHALNFAHERTRLVINFFNNVWRPFLLAAEKAGGKLPTPPQNWLSSVDMRNLLHLAGWELIRTETKILWPAPAPLLARFFNEWIAPMTRPLNLTVFQVARPQARQNRPHIKCSVVIPARNEAGNIEAAIRRTPEMGLGTEIIFVEGNSTDNTWEEIQRVARAFPERNIKTLQQTGRGKGGAVREGFQIATGDLLFILDADLTMPPEQLPKFYEAARIGTAEFVNGVRLVYPMENEAMQLLNMVANKLFGAAFTWLLGQPLKDTLCGTKVLFREDYLTIAKNRAYFGEFDPFGDFDLLFGAARLNLKMVDLPIRYQARTYGETNIHRWRHGWLLLQMVIFAARRMKFI